MVAAGARTGGPQAVAVFLLVAPVLRVAAAQTQADQAVAVFLSVAPVLRVAAAQIQVDPVVGGRPTTETGMVIRVPAGPGVPVAEGAILAAREEDSPGWLAPQTTATTGTAGATAPDRIWRRFFTGS